MGSMPYSLVSEALDLTQMVMDIQKHFFNNITKKSFPGRPRGQCPTTGCPRLWTSPRWSCTSGNNWIDLFYHTQQNVFQQCNQKLFPGDTLGSMSYTWVSEGLDLTQMVMDIQKQLKSTYFIIPNNFSFNNITKKSFPGTPRVNALLLGVRGSGPRPDGHGHRKQLKSTYFIIPNNFSFKNFSKKSIPGDARAQVLQEPVGGSHADQGRKSRMPPMFLDPGGQDESNGTPYASCCLANQDFPGGRCCNIYKDDVDICNLW